MQDKIPDSWHSAAATHKKEFSQTDGQAQDFVCLGELWGWLTLMEKSLVGRIPVEYPVSSWLLLWSHILTWTQIIVLLANQMPTGKTQAGLELSSILPSSGHHNWNSEVYIVLTSGEEDAPFSQDGGR